MKFSDIMSYIRNINYLKYFFIYWLIMSLFSYILMFIDKRKAIKESSRISEKTFFWLTILGGSIGTLFGMYHFRHKTQHWYFKCGVPLIIVIQLILIGFIYIKKII
ncbi:DUF1294 domain-containing protein [Fusobacterium sp. PH5-44]|uniref:DUF1294 domain-containing protein n=1 Tax=unclassified Fusobacterium TaxID=2648384 RepID=UPI003D1BC756